MWSRRDFIKTSGLFLATPGIGNIVESPRDIPIIVPKFLDRDIVGITVEHSYVMDTIFDIGELKTHNQLKSDEFCAIKIIYEDHYENWNFACPKWSDKEPTIGPRTVAVKCMKRWFSGELKDLMV